MENAMTKSRKGQAAVTENAPAQAKPSPLQTLVNESCKITDPQEWVKKCIDTYNPGMHRGLDKEALQGRLTAVEQAIGEHGSNPARMAHVARLQQLLS
jgi:hypothetical protein